LEVVIVRVRLPYWTKPWQRVVLHFIFVLCFTGCSRLGIGRPRPAPVAVPEVVQMSQAGVPVETLLQKMRDSETIYRLTASQLVHLHEEGVPNAVLDYMQETYLAAVRRDQALEDWRHWAWAGDGYWYGGRPYGWPRLWW
jgi:hypothetical protein